jgi:soluble lytic murein transglycosylase-like protein
MAIVQLKKWLNQAPKRKIFLVVLIAIISLSSFFVGRACADSKPVKMQAQKYEQYVRARPATTTTTTTTTQPTVNIKPKTPKAPSTTSAPPIVAVGEIQQYIVEQATAHGLDPQRMLRIAKCESGFNPGSVNYNYYAGGGNPSGIYQYLPETWRRIGGRSGYEATDVFNWQQNVRVTMWAFANGYAGEWACK